MPAKTSGNPLTLAEKRAIQGFFEDGVETKKIAMHLGRNVQTVKKFIDTELVNYAQLVEESKDKIPEEVEEAAFNQLVKSGLKEMDARASINKVRLQLKKAITADDVDALVRAALRNTTTATTFVRKTPGGRDGIAIASAASSMHGDVIREKGKTTSRTARGAVYQHKDGTVI